MRFDVSLKLFDVAKKIRSGQLKGEDAYKELNCFDSATELEEIKIIHFLYHYVTDVDIREKDYAYKKYQESYLDDLLNALNR